MAANDPLIDPNFLFVKPASDRPVRRPDTLKHLAVEGEHVPRDAFWLRRLADADVVETKQPSKTATK